MMRPRKMKRIELSILARDAGPVIEYLGRRGVIQLAAQDSKGEIPVPNLSNLEQVLDKLEAIKSAADYLGIELPEEIGDSAAFPTEEDEAQLDSIRSRLNHLSNRIVQGEQEKKRFQEALFDMQSFEILFAPFMDMDKLSFHILRIGRLDHALQEQLAASLGEKAMLIPLESDEDGVNDRFLAVASRVNREALDMELHKLGYRPIEIPEEFIGIPRELHTAMDRRLEALEKDLVDAAAEKEGLRSEFQAPLCRLASCYLLADQVERIKSQLTATASVYLLTGWIPAGKVDAVARDLEELTEDRLAIRSYDPEEIPEVQDGLEKVPVSLDHGAFVQSFERVVFSYGTPPYGSIDPTLFVAISFTILYGLMFGDLGQGLVLLALGILCGKRGIRQFQGFRNFSSPMIAVGSAAMLMGLLTGEVFTNEHLLEGPTHAILGFFMHLFRIPGEAPHRILNLMPDNGNISRLFYFFGFTLSVGIVLNSIGFIVNIINQKNLRNYEKAFFSKTGLAGMLLFWYALSIGLRVVAGGKVKWFDILGLGIPLLGIFFGHAIIRLASGHQPVLEDGFTVFVVEGLVEIMETASTLISSTVSFLRVGAFAMSHAVLSFIVFTLSGMARNNPVGPFLSLAIIIFGNSIIIILEGMIVAIQVVRLQYYEFFSKFFNETGVEFIPFRFHKGVYP